MQVGCMYTSTSTVVCTLLVKSLNSQHASHTHKVHKMRFCKPMHKTRTARAQVTDHTCFSCNRS